MTEETQGGNPVRDHPPVSKKLIKNPISLIGLALAVVRWRQHCLPVPIDLSRRSEPAPYIGILAYMVAPAFLVAGTDLDSNRHDG